MAKRVFISSVQSEFVEERAAIAAYIRGDPLFSRHFEVFLFEEQPAQSRSPVELYLDEVDASDVYVGLLGIKYGFEDADGVSPTEREFDRAVAKAKHRLAFIKEHENTSRESKERALIAKIEAQVTRRRFFGIPDLTSQLYASLIKVMEEERILSSRPFDAASAQLTFSFLNETKVRDFTSIAKEKRRFTPKRNGGPRDTLQQLNMFEGGSPNNAAVMLFSDNPQKVSPGAETKCQHFAGVQPIRPSLSHQVFRDILTTQADLAIEFVMQRLALSIGVRDGGAQVETAFEIPKPAVAEAIVNAIAHRDYTSNAGVQVTVFADRVEVANPGELPRGLTPELLRVTHSSIPKNPLIAEVFYLSGYIDKAGTGTLEMVHQCVSVGLPEPTFEQRGDQWTVTLWRDWLTEVFLNTAGLNERQIRGAMVAKATGRIDNQAYQDATGTPRRTAARDLAELAKKGILIRSVSSGRTARYERAKSRPADATLRGLETGQKRAKPKETATDKMGQKRAKPAKKPTKTLKKAVKSKA